MSIRFDLHCHSLFSDGTQTPTDIVHQAELAGLTYLALTDHDTVAGVPEALAASQTYGVRVIPAVELDNEWPHELHIIGLGIDLNYQQLAHMLAVARERREHRNAVIRDRLRQIGVTIELPTHAGSVTRLHIACALCQAGYARDVHDAFSQYLNPGMPGYYREPRFAPKEVIRTILAADGLPILAHPCHIRENPHALVQELVALGLKGLEAYYPSSTPGQTQMFVSLAKQYQLIVTCGSDYHGNNRPDIQLGCAFCDVEPLRRTAELLSRMSEKPYN